MLPSTSVAAPGNALPDAAATPAIPAAGFVGKLIVFCAPSGAGKTTIVRHLVGKRPEQLAFSISACTRDKRGRTEQHGKDYYFISADEFRSRIERDEFVEWEEVYEGAYYGTLKTELERIWATGRHAVLDLDVKGGLSVKRYFGARAFGVFVKPPSLEVLAERLTARNTDSASSISSRLYKAGFEMTFADKFDAVVVNDHLPDAIAQAERVVAAFLAP